MSRLPGRASTGTRPSSSALPRPLPARALQGLHPRLARAAASRYSTDAPDRGAPRPRARGLPTELDASLARSSGDPHQRVHGADRSLLPRRDGRLPAGPGAGRRRPGRSQLLDGARVLAGRAGRAAHADGRAARGLVGAPLVLGRGRLAGGQRGQRRDGRRAGVGRPGRPPRCCSGTCPGGSRSQGGHGPDSPAGAGTSAQSGLGAADPAEATRDGGSDDAPPTRIRLVVGGVPRALASSRRVRVVARSVPSVGAKPVPSPLTELDELVEVRGGRVELTLPPLGAARGDGGRGLGGALAPVSPRPRSPRSTCRSATPPAPCRRCRRAPPSQRRRRAAPLRRSAVARRPGGQVRAPPRAGARPTAAAREATISVLVSSIGSRSTCGKTSPIVAVSTFSSSSWPSGWPAFTISTPPGASRSRHSSKNSRVAR